MPTYTFDLNGLQPFEVGAWLMSLLVWPAMVDKEKQNAWARALCAEQIRVECAAKPEDAIWLQEEFRWFSEMRPLEIRQARKKETARFKRRMIAARMAMPFLYEGLSGNSYDLPPGVARPSIKEIAKYVLPEAHQNDPNMVERRIWRESKPAIALAAAFLIEGPILDPGSPGFDFPMDDLDLLKRIIERSELHAQIVLADGRFHTDPDDLIRLRYIPQQIAA